MSMTDNHEVLRGNLKSILYVYEAIVITTCLAAGAYISTSGGGSVLLAAPLLLIAAAEMMRIPVSAWSAHLRWKGIFFAFIVLVATALASFEGLAMVFELAISNRLVNVTNAERDMYHAQDAIDAKLEKKKDIEVHLDSTRIKLSSIEHDLANKEKSAPIPPSVSNGNCVGKNGRSWDCHGDGNARKIFAAAQSAHLNTLADIRLDRRKAQTEIDALVKSYSAINLDTERDEFRIAKQNVSDARRESPFHGLAASFYNKRVPDLTEDEFEAFKKYVVFGLAGAFSTLSMFVSIIVHSKVADPNSETEKFKLYRSLRALFARWRKKLIKTETNIVERIVEVEKEVIKTITNEVPIDRIVFKYVAVDPTTGLIIKPDYGAFHGNDEHTKQ